MSSQHASSKQAATAAWEFSEQNDLEMPSADWQTDTGHGPQDCFNVMVSKEDDSSQPKRDFVQYMSRYADSEVRLENGTSFMSITKSHYKDGPVE